MFMRVRVCLLPVRVHRRASLEIFILCLSNSREEENLFCCRQLNTIYSYSSWNLDTSSPIKRESGARYFSGSEICITKTGNFLNMLSGIICRKYIFYLLSAEIGSPQKV